jgi:chromosome partitioning protein
MAPDSAIEEKRPMAATVITIAQQKGGAGKTTLAAHLGVAWQLAGRSVALVDIDPQRSLATWFGLREAAVGHGDGTLSMSSVAGWRTQGQVDKLAADRDIVLIDSPPHAETEAKIAVRAARLVLVPVQPSPMDVWATKPTLDLAAGEGVPSLVVFNRVPARANLTEAMRAQMQDEVGVAAAAATVGNRVGFAAALNLGRTLNETAPTSPGAREIEALAEEILRLARAAVRDE